MADQNASAIIDAVGGPSNIDSLTHCATRLRFQLKDASGVDASRVESIPGVMGAVPQSGNRYQVVIGGNVAEVYSEITNLPQMKSVTAREMTDEEIKADARAGGPRGKFSWLDNFFEYLSDSFRPLLGVLLGASLIIAIAAILDALHIVDFRAANKTASWVFVDAMWNGVFYLLPLMVAYNAAKKLKIDPWTAVGVLGALFTPYYAALSKAADTVCTKNTTLNTESCVAKIFGLPLQLNNYGGQVMVPLLMVPVLALLYRALVKIFPKNVQMVFVPFLCLLIMIPVTAFLIGPLGIWVGNGIGGGLAYLNAHAPIVFAIIIPLLYPFLVPLGLHWPLNALMLININNTGWDFIQGPMGSWNFACFGATAGVLFLSMRDKDAEMSQTAGGALAAGLLGGISEPSLYGIHLRYKRIYPLMLVGCGVGGLLTGIFGGVKANAFVFTSLLTISVFNPMWVYLISIAAAFFTAMALVIMFDYRTPEQKAAVLARAADRKLAAAGVGAAGVGTASMAATAAPAVVAERSSVAEPVEAPAAKPAMVAGAVTTITSPVAGRVMPLAEVPDPVFAKGTVGQGVGIEPSEGVVRAPADGKVLVAQGTGHAVGLELDNGVQMLIHVGIDTVQMNGDGFELKVAKGDRVLAGQELVRFDLDKIKAAGYSTVTPVLVSNTKKFGSVEGVASGDVTVGTDLLKVTAK